MNFSFKFFHFKEEDVRVHCTLYSKGENLKSGIRIRIKSLRVRITPLLPPLCGLHVSFLLPCVLHVFLYSYVHNVQYATCLLSELSPAMCASCQLSLRQSYCYLSSVYISFMSATCLLSLVMSAACLLSPTLCAMCLLIQSCVLHVSFL